MRKLTRRPPYRALLVAALWTLLFTASGFAVADAHARPNSVPAGYIVCSETTERVEVTKWWSDTGDPNNYNQKLTVSLLTVRDSHDAAYCGEMISKGLLTYRRVSSAGTVTACIIDQTSQKQICDPVYQRSNTTDTFQQVASNTGPFGVPSCGDATVEWYIPNTIDIIVSTVIYCP